MHRSFTRIIILSTYSGVHGLKWPFLKAKIEPCNIPVLFGRKEIFNSIPYKFSAECLSEGDTPGGCGFSLNVKMESFPGIIYRIKIIRLEFRRKSMSISDHSVIKYEIVLVDDLLYISAQTVVRFNPVLSELQYIGPVFFISLYRKIIEFTPENPDPVNASEMHRKIGDVFGSDNLGSAGIILFYPSAAHIIIPETAL